VPLTLAPSSRPGTTPHPGPACLDTQVHDSVEKSVKGIESVVGGRKRTSLHVWQVKLEPGSLQFGALAALAGV
jgi:hypothetical protein